MKKTKVLVTILVVIVLLAIGIAYSLNNQKDTSPTDTIKVPGGPKIEIVYDGPAELTVEWERLEVKDLQLQIVGILTNSSDKTVKFDEITYWLDNSQRSFDNGTTLAPGETFRFGTGIVGYQGSSQQVTAKVEDFKIINSSVVKDNPTITETPKPTVTDTPEGKTFTSPPKNPKTPEEVVAAAYWLLSQGKFSEVEKFFSAEFLAEVNSDGGLEKNWEEFLNQTGYEKLEKIIVIKEKSRKEGLEEVWVEIYFSNGMEGTTIYLTNESGSPKIVE